MPEKNSTRLTAVRMKSKKILIVSRSIYPINSPRSFRTTELVKELSLQGHDVTLYIIKEYSEQDELAKEFGFILKNLGRPLFREIIPRHHNKNFALPLRIIRRFLLMLLDYPNIELMFRVRKVLKKETNYDLLISVAVPHPIHWGVAWARKKNHSIAKTWVADCGDPYMGDRMDSFRKFFYFKYFEKWFCRKADYISVPANDSVQYYYKEFHHKIKIIPQGFKFEDSRVYDGDIKNEVPTFGFAGMFLSLIRDPRPFLDYLCTLNKDFQFVVFSPNQEFLDPYRKRLATKLVDKGFIPRDTLLYELSKMDFLLHIEFHSSVESDSPSKFADYAIVNKPVIALNMENLDKAKFTAFLNHDYSKKLDLSAADKFRIENVTKIFLSLITDA
jgi:hypothetical protein